MCLSLCHTLVLLSYTNRMGFLQAVWTLANSSDERVACAALQLLSYIIHYFTKNNYQVTFFYIITGNFH